MNDIANRLREHAEALQSQPRSDVVEFTDDNEANVLLSDIENLPHLFVLASLGDQQITAKRAWMIPIRIGSAINSYHFSDFAHLEEVWLKKFFNNEGLHRFNDKVAGWYFEAIQRIKSEYGSDASQLWRDKPSSATVVRRFLHFDGIGIKIATMATNILARDFHVPMADYSAIDISPDIHVKRVFRRLGLLTIESDKSGIDLLYIARELNPTYPGIFDYSTWEIGQNWCKVRVPICSQCYMNDLCKKIDVKKVK